MKRARARHAPTWLSCITVTLLALQSTFNNRVFCGVQEYVELDPELLYEYGDAFGGDESELPGTRLQLEDLEDTPTPGLWNRNNHTAVDSVEALLDVLDAELDPGNVDPLGIPLLQQQPNDVAVEDLIQHITGNIESVLGRAGTSLSVVWSILASHVQQAGLLASAGIPAASYGSDSKNHNATSSHSDKGSVAGKDWVKETIMAAVQEVMKPGQQLSPQTTPQVIAHAVLSVIAAADQRAADQNTATSDSTGTSKSTETNKTTTAVGTTETSEGTGTNTKTHEQTQSAGNSSNLTGKGHKGRRLQQGAPGTNTGRLASAWRLVFGNFLDLINGGGRYWATVLANIAAFLLNNNLIRELSFYPEAWINDFWDTNQVPVPASNAAVLALVVAVIQGWCTLQTVGSAAQVLGSVTAPSLVITLQPATCPIRRDDNTGKQRIIWSECEAAQLIIRQTPWVFNAPFITGTSFTAGFCRYEYFLGTDSTYSVGGGNAGFTVRRSTRGFQILPVINQINLIARFSPYIFPQSPYGQNVNLTGGTLLSASTGYGLSEGGAVGPLGPAGGGGGGGGTPGGAGGPVTARSASSPTSPTTDAASSTTNAAGAGTLRSSNAGGVGAPRSSSGSIVGSGNGASGIGGSGVGGSSIGGSSIGGPDNVLGTVAPTDHMLSDSGLEDLFAHDGSIYDPSVRSWSLSPPPQPASTGAQNQAGSGTSFAAPTQAPVAGAAEQAVLRTANAGLKSTGSQETAFGDVRASPMQGSDVAGADSRVSYTDLLRGIVAQQQT